jgi:3-methylcrotonyl-CoA carboxylase alpha subunit
VSEKIVTVRGETKTIDVERNGDTLRAGSHEVTVVAIRADTAELRIDGRMRVVPFVVQGSTISFALDGEMYTVEVAEKASRSKARHRAHSMSAPMPGVVLKILASAGDVVPKGAPLLILEAMKMEHAIVAPYDGRVVAVHCKEGELVQPGNDLIELDQNEDSSR